MGNAGKLLFAFVLIVSSVETAQARGVKDPQALIPTIESLVQEQKHNLQAFKGALDDIVSGNPSFVRKTFTGLPVQWYVKKINRGRASTLYFLTDGDYSFVGRVRHRNLWFRKIGSVPLELEDILARIAFLDMRGPEHFLFNSWHIFRTDWRCAKGINPSCLKYVTEKISPPEFSFLRDTSLSDIERFPFRLDTFVYISPSPSDYTWEAAGLKGAERKKAFNKLEEMWDKLRDTHFELRKAWQSALLKHHPAPLYIDRWEFSHGKGEIGKEAESFYEQVKNRRFVWRISKDVTQESRRKENFDVLKVAAFMYKFRVRKAGGVERNKATFLAILDGMVEKGRAVKAPVSQTEFKQFKKFAGEGWYAYMDRSVSKMPKGAVLYNPSTGEGVWITRAYMAMGKMKELSDSINSTAVKIGREVAKFNALIVRKIAREYKRKAQQVNNVDSAF